MTCETFQAAFEPYRQDVRAISEQLATTEPERITSYLASGMDSHVFRLADDLVVKLPYEDAGARGYDPHETLDEYVSAYTLGMDVVGLEQMVAYSEDPLAVVCRYVPGVRTDKLEQRDRWRFTRAQYLGLFATFQTMDQRGLAFEVDAENMIYHDTEGFTVIDYVCDGNQSLGDKITAFASEVLLHDYWDEKVPGYALRFHDICYEALGEAMAERVMQRWREDHP